MALDAGSVGATLTGDFDSRGFIAFDRAMHRAKRGADGFATGLASATAKSNRAMGLLSRGAAYAAGAGIAVLAIGIGKAVSVAADFEAQLSSLAAVTKANGRTMAEFKKQALAAGAATKYSALEAAKAQTELAKGGLSVSKIMSGGLKGALALAAAGEMDLADAAKTTANALNLFNLGGGKAEHVADALAQAANATTKDVADFANGLAQGGGAARAAGLSFDETVAALEALVPLTSSGADAGTSLKAALVQIASPSDEAAGLMKKLGLAFFDAQGSLKPLPVLAAMLKDKLGGLTREQRLAAVSTIAGTDGMRTLLALYQAGPSQMEDFLKSLKEQGTAAEVAAKKQDNLKGKIENLKGSLETAAIIIGTELIPAFTDLAEDATAKVNEMAESGQLKAIGESIAEGVKIGAKAIVWMVGQAKDALEGMLGIISRIGHGLVAMADLANKLDPFGNPFDTSGMKESLKELDGIRDRLAGRIPPVEIKADPRQALVVLRNIESTKLRAKVVKVLGQDTDAKTKLRALIALGIPKKQATVLADVGDALSGISTVKSQLRTLDGMRAKVTIQKAFVEIGKGISSLKNVGGSGLYIDPKKKADDEKPLHINPGATGRKVSGPEIALIGEGGGPEYIIPTEPRYRARGIGLLMAAAEDLGVGMFAKGKAPKGKGPRRKVPPKGSYLKLSPEEYDRIVSGDEQIADNKVEKGARKGKLTQDALAARRRLPGERTAARRAHQHARAIEAHEAEAEIARDLMERADRRDDTPGFNRARKRRLQELLHVRRLAQEGLKYARPGSKWGRELRAKLATLGLTVDEAREAEIELEQPEEPETFTKPEQARLAQLNADEALAALTEPTADDLVAAGARAAFLQGILSSAILNPAARGGPGAIAEIAGQLKSARDSVSELSKPPDVSADLQAQLEQANRRAETAQTEARFNAQALSVFSGLGDIGAGPNITIQTLHPGDPRTLAAVGDAATRGQAMQGAVKSSRERLGW